MIDAQNAFKSFSFFRNAKKANQEPIFISKIAFFCQASLDQ